MLHTNVVLVVAGCIKRLINNTTHSETFSNGIEGSDRPLRWSKNFAHARQHSGWITIFSVWLLHRYQSSPTCSVVLYCYYIYCPMPPRLGRLMTQHVFRMIKTRKQVEHLTIQPRSPFLSAYNCNFLSTPLTKSMSHCWIDLIQLDLIISF